jgi:hypothetical protein
LVHISAIDSYVRNIAEMQTKIVDSRLWLWLQLSFLQTNKAVTSEATSLEGTF